VKEFARIVAAVAASLSLYGLSVAAILLRARWLLLWPFLLLVVLCLLAAILLFRDTSPAVLWPPLGAIVGFVVLVLRPMGAGFSLGTILVLAAGGIQLLSYRPRDFWDAVIGFIAGASAIGMLVWLRRVAVSPQERSPVIVTVGSWVFIATLGLAWATHHVRSRKHSTDGDVVGM
jgi:hypothetical protein